MNEGAIFDKETLDYFDNLLESDGKEDIRITLRELNASPQELIDYIKNNSKNNLDDESLKLINDLKSIQKQSLKRRSSLIERKTPLQYAGAEETLSREDLIEEMAEKAGITRGAAKKALDSLLFNIEGALHKGNKVSLIGFGSWTVSKRSAHESINPQNGKIIRVKAKNVVKFKAGSVLAKAVN